jgi:hypothetical protein
MRRVTLSTPIVLAALALAACTTRASTVSRGSIDTGASPGNVALASQRTLLATSALPGSALLAAEQQLEANGYLIGARQGDLMITTAARPVPDGTDTTGIGTPVKEWVLRVDALRDTLGRATDVRVIGFLIPVDSTAAAVEITPRQRELYTEVQRAASWIQGAVPASRRQGPGRFETPQ